MPLVAVLLALVAVAFFALPLIGLLRRVAVERPLGRPQRPGGTRRDPPVDRVLALVDVLLGASSACRSPTCSRGRGSPAARSCARWSCCPMVLPPVVGGVALLFAFQRNNGLVGGLIYDLFDFQFTFSKWGVDPGRDVRGHAVPRDHRRSRAAVDGPSLRGRRRQPRRRTVDGVPARHRADDRTRADRRRRAGVGARARRVRRDHHVRRQHPGPHPDHAARGLQPARVATNPSRSRSAWCCSRSRSWCSSRCATTGSEAFVTGVGVTLRADVGVRLGRLDLRGRARRGRRRDRRRARPERRGQVDAAARARGSGAARRRFDRASTTWWWTSPRRARSSCPSGAASAWCSRTTCCSRTSRVLENVAFGLRSRGTSRAEARRRAHGVAGARRARRPCGREAGRRSPAVSSSASRWRARW